MRVMRWSWVVFGLAVLPSATLPASTAPQSHDEGPIQLRLTFVESTPLTTVFIGTRAIRAIVDTSAGDADGALTLSHDVIQSAGGTRLGDASMIDQQGRRFIRPRFRIPFVIVDGHVIRDVNVVEALPSAVETAPSPNVIGKFFLSRYYVVIDFAAANVSLWPPQTQNPTGVDCGKTAIPMESTKEERLAVSAFDIPAGSVRLSWTTGASRSFLAETAATRLRLVTANGEADGTKFLRPTTLSAAGRKFAPLEFVVLPLRLSTDFDGMLGRDFFDQHLVCLDYQRREVRVR